jgi:drug/metabolite transporter (DMT)-like permease
MSTSSANRLRLAPVALISLAAAWGLAFVVMKDSIERQSVNSFLFTRFGIATLVLLVLRPMIFRLITKRTFHQRIFSRAATWCRFYSAD